MFAVTWGGSLACVAQPRADRQVLTDRPRPHRSEHDCKISIFPICSAVNYSLCSFNSLVCFSLPSCSHLLLLRSRYLLHTAFVPFLRSTLHKPKPRGLWEPPPVRLMAWRPASQSALCLYVRADVFVSCRFPKFKRRGCFSWTANAEGPGADAALSLRLSAPNAEMMRKWCVYTLKIRIVCITVELVPGCCWHCFGILLNPLSYCGSTPLCRAVCATGSDVSDLVLKSITG